MGFKRAFANVALVVAAFAAAFGVGSLIVKFNDAAHPVSQGQEYLADQGYKDISGGEVSYFNACGKNVFARKYEVADGAGGREQRTVCFNPLFGPGSPWLGK